MSSPNNKLIAKNALLLTLRMMLVTIVGLYTSRIVLQALGVIDYGLYGVIGGVVGMASFLNSSMAGATSRFIAFELGRNNSHALKNIFSTALIIHFIIAIIVMILAETIGLWFLNTQMDIPADRMFAANVLYQFSVFSVLIGFTQVPYQATIIAHEKMNVFAYIEIINVALKLINVYLIQLASNERIIIYAALTFGASILIALFYRFYCIKNYPEAKFSTRFDRCKAKELLSFSVFNLYGQMSIVARSQGQPIVLNIFFGLIANAGASIASTIEGAITGLTTSIFHAFRPQIIKQYASNDIFQMQQIMRRAVQFTILAFAIFAIPISIETPRILQLWLGQVPEYSVPFLRLILLTSLISIINFNNVAAIHATGNIKRISFISGTFNLLCPIVSYLFLKAGNTDANTIYIVNCIMMLIVTVLGLFFIKIQIPSYDIYQYIGYISKSIIAIFLSMIAIYLISDVSFSDYKYYETSFWSSIVICMLEFLLGAIILIPITFIIALSKNERIYATHKTKQIVKRLIHI
ncbi:MAG: polysaccharide biosynthesis protein [Muribaculaceae bacterium]|nr:polysaccharide biosynthesis protein [Muribaculaceae bacterium]